MVDGLLLLSLLFAISLLGVEFLLKNAFFFTLPMSIVKTPTPASFLFLMLHMAAPRSSYARGLLVSCHPVFVRAPGAPTTRCLGPRGDIDDDSDDADDGEHEVCQMRLRMRMEMLAGLPAPLKDEHHAESPPRQRPRYGAAEARTIVKD